MIFFGLPLWAWIIIILAVIGIGVLKIYVAKKIMSTMAKRKKEESNEEDN